MSSRIQEYLLHVEGNGLLKNMSINEKMGGCGSSYNNDADMGAAIRSLNAVQKGLELLDSVTTQFALLLPYRVCLQQLDPDTITYLLS